MALHVFGCVIGVWFSGMPYSCGLVTVSLSARITGCILVRLIQASALVISFWVASHCRLIAHSLYTLRPVHRRSPIATLLMIIRQPPNQSMKPTTAFRNTSSVFATTPLPWLISISLEVDEVQCYEHLNAKGDR